MKKLSFLVILFTFCCFSCEDGISEITTLSQSQEDAYEPTDVSNDHEVYSDDIAVIELCPPGTANYSVGESFPKICPMGDMVECTRTLTFDCFDQLISDVTVCGECASPSWD